LDQTVLLVASISPKMGRIDPNFIPKNLIALIQNVEPMQPIFLGNRHNNQMFDPTILTV